MVPLSYTGGAIQHFDAELESFAFRWRAFGREAQASGTIATENATERLIVIAANSKQLAEPVSLSMKIHT